MEETLLSLLLIPVEIIGGLGALLLLLGVLLRLRSRKRRDRRRRERRAHRNQPASAVASVDTSEDATEHLPSIKAYPMPVIGLIEERIFDELEDIAGQSIMGHRVLTQLSLSAFLYAGSAGYSRADEQKVAAHLANLQVDFLIVDGDWRPVVAVSIARDESSAHGALEVEGEICAQAGVAYMIVGADGMSEQRQAEIKHLLQPQAGIAAQ